MVESLSPQEQRVLELAAQGLTDKGIGSSLGISPTTVVTYWSRIRAKLGLHSRPELVAHFIRHTAETDLAVLKGLVQDHEEQIEHLAQSLETLRQYIDLAPEAMLIIHPDGIIQSGNEEAARILGCAILDFEALPIARFIPPEFQQAHQKHRLDYLQDPHRMEMGHADGVEVVDFAGRKFRGAITINLAPTPLGDAIVVNLRKLGVTP
ncbi:MAG: hypothetical protein HONBIEJF_00916 [Fimbriimonadaceae bacterium]|nr:hypothetical protein [Fimbriimonadaceae bacterium]